MDKDEQEKESGRYIRREDIKARFEYGILTLLIPKEPVLPVEDRHRILIE